MTVDAIAERSRRGQDGYKHEGRSGKKEGGEEGREGGRGKEGRKLEKPKKWRRRKGERRKEGKKQKSSKWYSKRKCELLESFKIRKHQDATLEAGEKNFLTWTQARPGKSAYSLPAKLENQFGVLGVILRRASPQW